VDQDNCDATHNGLLEQVARWRMLVGNAFDGILISQDGVVTEVSEPLLATSGYTLDEMIGRPVTGSETILVVEDQAGVRDAIIQKPFTADALVGRIPEVLSAELPPLF
jgi:PAS domain S-box-containing protein